MAVTHSSPIRSVCKGSEATADCNPMLQSPRQATTALSVFYPEQLMFQKDGGKTTTMLDECNVDQ